MDSPVFPHFRVFVEENKGQEEATAEVFEGDIVGCGFDVKDVEFDDAGIPVSNQRLRVYFTRNGGEVRTERNKQLHFKQTVCILTVNFVGRWTASLGKF